MEIKRERTKSTVLWADRGFCLCNGLSLLVAFQSRNGLTSDGISGPRTNATLAQGLNVSIVKQSLSEAQNRCL